MSFSTWLSLSAATTRSWTHIWRKSPTHNNLTILFLPMCSDTSPSTVFQPLLLTMNVPFTKSIPSNSCHQSASGLQPLKVVPLKAIWFSRRLLVPKISPSSSNSSATENLTVVNLTSSTLSMVWALNSSWQIRISTLVTSPRCRFLPTMEPTIKISLPVRKLPKAWSSTLSCQLSSNHACPSSRT